MKLGGLLPIHAVRERRAQRLHYEQSQAYERALSAQMHASTALEHLQQSYQNALSSALEGGAMSAAYAQALLEQAVVAQRDIAPAQKELNDKQAQAEQALAAAQEARAHYASKVCMHHKMRELCSLQDARDAKVAEARSEVESDDEFVAPWLERQMRFKGAA
jgi:poly-gamma-glutamate capsule biosynthesis protein CapA/YwtB (metallophosphatase superfamily)